MSELEALIEADAASDARLIEASARLKRADAHVKKIEDSKPTPAMSFNELAKASAAAWRRAKFGDLAG
jgi:hypothetical protein